MMYDVKQHNSFHFDIGETSLFYRVSDDASVSDPIEYPSS